MTSTRRITPLLLAASVFLTGATGAFLGAMTPAQAITSVDELTDVNENHWAYEALRDLVEKYDVIEGYPNHTFRGERTATRWELAAALNALIKAVGRDLARLGAEKADKTDLQTLARLQEQFRNELAALQARTSALESRATAIEAKNTEQDTRLSLLEKTQLHGDMSFGGLADISAQGVHGGQNDGIRDGISAIGRLRLTLDVPVKEDSEDSKIGRGDVHARLIAAFGRMSPTLAQQGNGGSFGTFTGYSRIAGDASAFNEGIGSGNNAAGFASGGTNLRANLYVENVHYKQHFKSGIPLLSDWTFGTNQNPDWETTGDLYVGVVPWRYLFDKSPYRGNELTQFQNTAFVNTPGVAVNQNLPMVAYAWHQELGRDDLSLDVTSGVGTINSWDAMGGLNLSYEARLNYALSSLPGNLYAGGYHAWSAGSSGGALSNYGGAGGVLGGTAAGVNRNGVAYPAGTHYSTNAFYVGWNQEWYKGIGTTINYLLSNNGNGNLLYNSLNQTQGIYNSTTGTGLLAAPRQSLSGVLNIPLAALGFSRENDAFGIGYALVDLQEGGVTGAGHSDRWEQVSEAYYRWQVNESISVVPSVQFYWNRLGLAANGFTTVLGLRTNFLF